MRCTRNEGHENIGSIRTGKNVDDFNPINADYIVSSSANVILKATEEIKLEVGTTIKAGAEFRAFIDEFNGECGEWLLPRIVPNDNPVVDGNLVDKANIQEENIQQIEVNIFPNPFKNDFNLNIHLTQRDEFSLMVFNATGQLIYIQNGQLDMGKHQLNVPINQVNGLYIVRLQVGSEIITKKLIKYE